MRTLGYWLIFTSGAALASTPAMAQWEVEADPFAYMVNGYSGHIARQIFDGRARVQIGLFAEDVPSAFHGEDNFYFRAQGVTLKADYFFSGITQGWFVGLDGDYSKTRYRLKETHESTTRNRSGFGPRAGYRFEMGDNVYVTPWISIRYIFNTENVVVSGNEFSEDDIAIFPTVHLGWRF